jgi:hypothetical protein
MKMKIDSSKEFGKTTFGNDAGTEFRRRDPASKTGDGAFYARFNPNDIDSAMSAAHYVGATQDEQNEIRAYFESLAE